MHAMKFLDASTLPVLLQEGSAIEAVDALHVADRRQHAQRVPFHQPVLPSRRTVKRPHILLILTQALSPSAQPLNRLRPPPDPSFAQTALCIADPDP